MSFTFGNSVQQIKQPTSSFSDLQSQNKSLSCQTTPAPTGFVFGTATTTAPSGFSFACTTPIQENAPNKCFFNETLPNTQLSFFTSNASTPLANLFSKTISTSTTGFCVPSLSTCSTLVPSTVSGDGFGTATATTEQIQFSFKNETDANKSLRFALGPFHSKGPFLFHQTASNANISNNFTFFTTPIIAPSASTASTGFAFKDTQGTNNCKEFSAAQTGDVTISSVSNASSGFNSGTQQPSKFQFSIPTSHSAVYSSSCPARSSGFHTLANTPGSSKFSSSAQSGYDDGFKVPSRTVLKKEAVIGNQCLFCMKEHENQSLEEIRLEAYDSIRNGVTVDSDLRFKNGAHNFSFLNATHFPHDFAWMKNRDMCNQTEHNQNSTGFATPLTFTTEPFSHGRTFNASLFDQNKQHKDLALALSNDVGSVDQAEKSQNAIERIFDDPKCKSVVDGSCNVSGCLNPILSQHIEMPPTSNDVKKLALDSLIALMIISKTNSVPDVLNMIPGNVGLDDFKAHLICAAEEFNNELLSKKVDELMRQLAKISSKIIYIKLPTGEILIRSFLADTPLSLLLTYIASQGYPNIEYKVLTIWSRQDLTVLNKNQTLEDLKLYPKDYLTVEKR